MDGEDFIPDFLTGGVSPSTLPTTTERALGHGNVATGRGRIREIRKELSPFAIEMTNTFNSSFPFQVG